MANGVPLKVFISYCRRDEGVARLIAKTLEDQHIDCWIDRRPSPDDWAWERSTGPALRSSNCYLVLISPQALESSEVSFEIGAALVRAKLRRDAALIPVLIGDVGHADLPGYLRSADPIDATAMRLGELETHLLDRLNRLSDGG